MTKAVTPPAANPYNDRNWWRLRARIINRQDGRCLWCRASIRGKGAARVDHIKPVRENPDDFWNEGNLRALCPGCDAKRHYEKGAAGNATPRPQIGPDGFRVDNDGDLWRDKRTVDPDDERPRR